MLERLKTLYKEIRPNAMWDLTKWAIVGLIALAGGAALFIRQLPYELWVVVGFGFIWTLLLIVVAYRTSRQSLNPSAEEKPTEGETVTQEYQVECVRLSEVPMNYSGGRLHVHNSRDPNYVAIVARFLSKPLPTAKNLSVKAIITAESPDYGKQYVYDGVWLDDRNSYQSLESGGYVELILVLRKQGVVFLCEREHMHYSNPSFAELEGSYATIKVELVGKRSSGIVLTQPFEFRINLTPKFRVHQLGKSDYEIAKN